MLMVTIVTIASSARHVHLFNSTMILQVSKKTTGGGSGSSGRPSVMDLLVMENVLYATNTSRIYDLKGSERSRWSQEDPTQSGSVLMDDNLRENNLTQPILVSDDCSCLQKL